MLERAYEVRQDINKLLSASDLLREVNSFSRSISLLCPGPDFLILGDNRVVLVVGVHERSHEALLGIVYPRRIVKEWEVLELRTDVGVDQSSTLEVSLEVV